MNNANFDKNFELVATFEGDVSEFANGTGYYDNLCYQDIGLEVQNFTDEYGRRGLIIPLLDGYNIVIFERYSASTINALVSNTPFGGAAERVLGIDSQVDDEAVDRLIGDIEFSKEKEADIRKMFNRFRGLMRAVEKRDKRREQKAAE